MSQASIYLAAKPSIIGHQFDIDKQYGNQCVDVDLYMAQLYFPGVDWRKLIPPVPSAKLLGISHKDKYFQWIPNDHSNPNQVPQPGDLLVCGATPKPGYLNQYRNDDGHTGIVDHADARTVTLLMQDGSNPGGVAFLQTVPWRYRPVDGWLRPRLVVAPSSTKARLLHIAQDTNDMHVYKPGGPYDASNRKNWLGVIHPSQSPGGMLLEIVQTLANGVYRVKTPFGVGDLWTKGSSVTVK